MLCKSENRVQMPAPVDDGEVCQVTCKSGRADPDLPGAPDTGGRRPRRRIVMPRGGRSASLRARPRPATTVGARNARVRSSSATLGTFGIRTGGAPDRVRPMAEQATLVSQGQLLPAEPPGVHRDGTGSTNGGPVRGGDTTQGAEARDDESRCTTVQTVGGDAAQIHPIGGSIDSRVDGDYGARTDKFVIPVLRLV